MYVYIHTHIIHLYISIYIYNKPSADRAGPHRASSDRAKTGRSAGGPNDRR